MSSEPSSTAAVAGLALAAEEAAPPYGERPQQDQTVRVLNPLTLRFQTRAAGPAAVGSQRQAQPLREVRSLADLAAGTWCRGDQETTICFDLPRGESVLTIEGHE